MSEEDKIHIPPQFLPPTVPDQGWPTEPVTAAFDAPTAAFEPAAAPILAADPVAAAGEQYVAPAEQYAAPAEQYSAPADPYQAPAAPATDPYATQYYSAPQQPAYGAVPPAYQPPQTYQPAEPPAGPGKHAWSGGAIVGAAVAGALIGGVIMAAAMFLVFGASALSGPKTTTTTAQPAAIAPLGQSQKASIETTEPDQPVEAVATKLTPSVVNVSIQQSVSNPWQGTSQTQTVGNGSGVIIRSDGYILTNNHVVENATGVLVRIGLKDVPARVIGTDASSDIAVIKVDKTGLTPAVIGDSDALAVGEQVVAIGSPFGLDKTVTSGIISALHRSGQGGDQFNSTYYANLIQTDAPINPGNSGGALCDLDGKVIGINTLIQTGGAQQSAGIGFAIPIKLAAQVAEQLIAGGKASHAFLGVSAVTVDQAAAQQYGLKVTAGALVQEVQKSSPADKAGIKQDDVIVKVGDQDISTSQDMVADVRAHKPGDTVTVTLDRGGKMITVDVALGTAE
jgi:putative serine protease PepD